ncbi:MAG: NADP-specific glutamate dehydrogenase [Elusimicrobiota bacterium]|jgi:glutamate dehydrogenase (NADP+)|nr:NADP-specific glutamate dehydrogenase [Elusimicrobiota bacterium]
MSTKAYLQSVMDGVKKKDPAEQLFHQAVEEVLITLEPILDAQPKYMQNAIVERMVEPERVITFRVPWTDDKGQIHINRGYRVQFNSAIGPYKGGLRFHETVALSTLKFLGFEQTFKNSLTGLPMGGGKGGSDFDTRGKSEAEVMRYCQAFMTELYRHIGENTDVPAGDLGLGGREIGYLFGQYKKITNRYVGVLTGKGLEFGGSLIRTEATGYGVVYFAEEMMKLRGDSLKGKTCIISGAGNVGIHTAEKLLELGAKVVGMSDYSGAVYDEEGLTTEKIAYLKDLIFNKRGLLTEYVKKYTGAKHLPGKKSWSIPCYAAFPTSRENELDGNDAKELLKNGCKLVCEGANMPCSPEAITAFQQAKILYAPGKAANAGGVACSGLEMTQNSIRLSWTREEVDAHLHKIMQHIHSSCVNAYKEFGTDGDYLLGANIAGFKKVADAMLAQGIV